jgi:hypothetical protein
MTQDEGNSKFNGRITVSATGNAGFFCFVISAHLCSRALARFANTLKNLARLSYFL